MFRCVLTGETRWCLDYSAIFLNSKVICEKRYILKSLFFFFFTLTRPGGVKIWPNEINSGTIGLRTSQGFVWFPFHSSTLIRGEMAWGCTPHVRSRMGKSHVPARVNPPPTRPFLNNADCQGVIKPPADSLLWHVEAPNLQGGWPRRCLAVMQIWWS